MTPDQDRHVSRVLSEHERLTRHKYVAGQVEHQGNCWEKPGMLAHGLDEVADLTVYLWTVREQLLALADRVQSGGGPLWVVDEIRRVCQK